MRSASKLTPRHVHTAQIACTQACLVWALILRLPTSITTIFGRSGISFLKREGWFWKAQIFPFSPKSPIAFEKSTFFEFMLKSCKFRKTRDRSHSADPKRDCPRGGQIQPAWGFLAILFPSCCPTCRQLPGRHRCVPTGKHSPHPKDCPGLGDPHTLKLRTN